MARVFEIYKKDSSPTVVVKRGFCWPGFLLTWIWALARKLWLQAILFLLVNIVGAVAILFLFEANPIVSGLFSLAVQFTFGLRANSWRTQKLEANGYNFVGTIVAASATAALSTFSRSGVSGSARPASRSFISAPAWFQRLFAITWLTWKAAFRFRLFIVIAVLLLAAVIGLPILIKDDGTARGFTQILLTYTLTTITALLGLSTLWLACGTLARDIEECQIQMLAVKPIARWEIWLGKWLGIMSLNASLLLLSGLSVYGLLQWRATKLPAAEQKILRNEVLVARASAKKPVPEKEIEEETELQLKAALEKTKVTVADLPLLRQQIKEGLKANLQVVPPGYVRAWEIDLGFAKNSIKDQPLYLRVKFNAAEKSPSGTFLGMWQVGIPKKTQFWQTYEPMSLAPDTFHEFEIPAGLFDENGMLTISFLNPNNTALLFPLDDGIEVLYREGGFGLNFARGLGIIFCWMALLAALGLAAASFMSFPVAAFASLAALVVVFSTGTLANAVTEGTILGYDPEHGSSGPKPVDTLVIPVFRAILGVVNLAKNFSPIDALSSGRSISWGELSRAFAQIVLLLGGILALIGIWSFTRRELATAQNQS